MTDLNKKQDFWAEQLPSFKENYICLAQLEAVEFNCETGSFDALTKDATGFDLEDILEAYHSVNTGWAMWLRAKAQAVPDTHLLVPKEPVEDVVIWLLCEKDIGDNLSQAEYFYKELVKKFVEASESGAEG